MTSWRVLIANVTLAGRTGTETAARDLAVGLLAAGQRPMVYSPDLGDIAAEIAASGVPVVSDLRSLPEPPDIVHGNHYAETVESLLRFPTARALFVCHDRTSPMSIPPLMGRVLRFVAVDENCLERLGEYAIPEHRTSIICNSVDTVRFRPRLPLPLRPERALVFSNYAGPGTHLESVETACASLKIPVHVMGSVSGTLCAAPEQVLGGYDLVFAKARCALEAMAVGTAVVLCDRTGLGPLVTLDEVARLRRWNFGARVLREPLEPDAIAQQIRRYDPADATAVSRYVREHANLADTLAQYLQLYNRLMEEPLPEGHREVNNYLQRVAIRVGELEQRLTQYRRPDRMEPLSDADCARLTLRIGKCPSVVQCGTTIHVETSLENGSSEKLGSFPPYPLQLSYRWLEPGNGGMLAGEGVRTPLWSPVLPGKEGAYAVRVVVPELPGEYRLRLTLVQESIRWLDALADPVGAEVSLSVVASPAPSRSA